MLPLPGSTGVLLPGTSGLPNQGQRNPSYKEMQMLCVPDVSMGLSGDKAWHTHMATTDRSTFGLASLYISQDSFAYFYRTGTSISVWWLMSAHGRERQDLCPICLFITMLRKLYQFRICQKSYFFSSSILVELACTQELKPY